MSVVQCRKRGPKPKITGDRLLQLVSYMQDPSATTEAAALVFGVHPSTIEKTLARLRKTANAKAAKKALSKTAKCGTKAKKPQGAGK